MFNKILLVGDSFGINKLLPLMPAEKVSAIIAASIRPQYIRDLEILAGNYDKPLIIQPKYNTKDYESFILELSSLGPDLLICCSYSMLIRDDLLSLVNNNAINVHSSLLPKNRGPNPVQWSIIRGEDKSGVTIHYMDSGLDTGSIIAQKEVDISHDDSWVDVSQKIDLATDIILKENMQVILNGNIASIPQDNEQATVNFRLNAEYPKIDFDTMSDIQIYNLIRAQVPPLRGAYYIDNKGNKHYLDKLISISQVMDLRKSVMSSG